MAYLQGNGPEGDYLRNRFSAQWVPGAPVHFMLEDGSGNVELSETSPGDRFFTDDGSGNWELSNTDGGDSFLALTKDDPEGDGVHILPTGVDSAARTVIAWGNVNFTPPDAAWVRFNVHHFPVAEIVSLGNPGANLRRIDGTVIVEVFVPVNQGEGTIDDYCDAAAAIYRDHTSQQGLRFGEPWTVPIGEQGAWYKKDVMVPFVRDWKG